MKYGEGLHYDIPEAEYHALPGLSSTGAKKILRSPAHFQHYMNAPRVEKAEFDTGSAVHSKVLGVGAQIAIYPDGKGPETFEFEGVELPTVLSKAGSLGTNASKAFEDQARAAGLIPVKRVVAAIVNRMAESVLQNDTARGLLEGGHPEVSMIYTDPITGVLSRGRLDYLKPRAIVDLKTCGQDATESAFSRQVFNLGYDVQFGQYEFIYEGITGETPPWLWVVVEANAPYLTNVFVLGEDEQQMGRERARIARERYAEAKATNRWGGYRNRTGQPIGIVRAPMYSIYDYQDEMEGTAA